MNKKFKWNVKKLKAAGIREVTAKVFDEEVFEGDTTWVIFFTYRTNMKTKNKTLKKKNQKIFD